MGGEAIRRRRGSEAGVLHPIAAIPLAALAVTGLVTAVLVALNGPPRPPATMPADATSAMAFGEMAKVMFHPRCTNCHTSADRPRQGEVEDNRVHQMNVVRGLDDRGSVAQRCQSCHGRRNHDASGVPGAPHWQLAPRSMGWDGMSVGDLCRAVTDRRRNGDRMPDAIVAHLAKDPLVRWAWQPGGDRTPPPMPFNEFLALARFWAGTGARCP